MAKTIAIVNGSLRKNSFNQTIVEYVKEKLEAKGYSVTELNISNLPFINQDIEFPAPESVAAIREELKKAEALWIVTPEYNGSIPGPLKNMLDWISRPVEQGVYGAPEFVKDKLVAISGAAGSSKAAYVLEELNGLLTRMAMNPLEVRTGIALSMEAFQTGVFTLSAEDKEQLDQQIEKFLEALK